MSKQPGTVKNQRKLTFVVAEDEYTTGGRYWVVSIAELPAFHAQGGTIDTALEDAAVLLRSLRELHDEAWDALAQYLPDDLAAAVGVISHSASVGADVSYLVTYPSPVPETRA